MGVGREENEERIKNWKGGDAAGRLEEDVSVGGRRVTEESFNCINRILWPGIAGGRRTVLG